MCHASNSFLPAIFFPVSHSPMLLLQQQQQQQLRAEDNKNRYPCVRDIFFSHLPFGAAPNNILYKKTHATNVVFAEEASSSQDIIDKIVFPFLFFFFLFLTFFALLIFSFPGVGNKTKQGSGSHTMLQVMRGANERMTQKGKGVGESLFRSRQQRERKQLLSSSLVHQLVFRLRICLTHPFLFS